MHRISGKKRASKRYEGLHAKLIHLKPETFKLLNAAAKMNNIDLKKYIEMLCVKQAFDEEQDFLKKQKNKKEQLMKTFFLIDGTNNNKVVNEFDSDKEAMDYVDAKEHIENWENSFDTFEDFKEQFYTVDSDEMEEAVRSSGSRKRNYWT